MITTKKHPLCKAIMTVLAIGPVSAYAQDAAVQAVEEDTKPVEELIVTGTAGGVATSQLDAAFSVTSIDTEEITRFAPKSTADLLKTVPGVWAESSGGVSGANIFVRGLPSTGDADFVTISLQGSPVYGASTLSFLEQTTLFRVDETIERMEGLRGGANTVFANGQPGLTSNFILKEGSDESEGLVKVTVSDYSLKRLDAVHSGALGSDWYYMVGGYVSESNGVRDAGFASDTGSQFTFNITKDLDDGHLSIYNRYTDDHGQWYLPIPVDGGDQDLGSYTQLSEENRIQTLDIHPTRDSGSTLDLGKGRGWKGNVFGVNFDKSFGDITINNHFNYMAGDANTLGLVPAGNVGRADTISANFDYTPLIGTAVSDGSVVAAGTVLDTYGAWIVEKELTSLSNDFSVTATLGSHNLTGGIFYNNFSSDDVWSLGNSRVFVIGGGRVEADCVDLDNCGAFAIVQNGEATKTGLYLHDKWQVSDRIALDLGVRRDKHDVAIDFASATANATPPFDVTVPAFTRTETDQEETSFTAGAIYNVTDDSSVFIRVNEGYDFSYFDDLRGGSLDTQEVSQAELGYKWQGDISHAYITYFKSVFNGAEQFTQTGSGPVSIGAAVFEARGVEVDADYAMGDFNVNVNATLQTTEQVDSTVAADVGNKAPRLPDLQYRISPSYSVDISYNMDVVFYGAMTYAHSRFSDAANTQALPAYTKYDVGAMLTFGDAWDFRVSVDNASDEEGFTQGNPQVFTATSTARPILGRSVKASVQYSF
jgi:iron complex outermembrane receptor protein